MKNTAMMWDLYTWHRATAIQRLIVPSVVKAVMEPLLLMIQSGAATLEKRVSSKVQPTIIINPSKPGFRYLPKDNEELNNVYRKIWMQSFITAPFLLAMTQKQLGSLSVGEGKLVM